MTRYLFLDLYGVLNLDDCLANDNYGPIFDLVAVDNLRRIIEEVSPSIVITSSWRTMGMEWLKDLWNSRAMPGEIYSATPILERTQYEVTDPGHIGSVLSMPERYAKGLEIERWLATNSEGPYHYAIVDDEPYFLMGQARHFVQTQSDVGLSAMIADRLIEILK